MGIAPPPHPHPRVGGTDGGDAGSDGGDADRPVLTVVGQFTVAVPAVVTQDQVRELRTRQLRRSSLHNAALKYLRHTHEDPPGLPTVDRVDITHHDPFHIGGLRRGSGVVFTSVENESQQWSWRYRLAPFSNEVLQQLIARGGRRSLAGL